MYFHWSNIIIVIIGNTQDFVYPQDVAYPIGGANGQRFLVMELHYDNPGRNSSNKN